MSEEQKYNNGQKPIEESAHLNFCPENKDLIWQGLFNYAKTDLNNDARTDSGSVLPYEDKIRIFNGKTRGQEKWNEYTTKEFAEAIKESSLHVHHFSFQNYSQNP